MNAMIVAAELRRPEVRNSLLRRFGNRQLLLSDPLRIADFVDQFPLSLVNAASLRLQANIIQCVYTLRDQWGSNILLKYELPRGVLKRMKGERHRQLSQALQRRPKERHIKKVSYWVHVYHGGLPSLGKRR